MSELLALSASELARRIRARRVSSSEAMQETIAAAKRAHARLNCFVRIDEAAALAAARRADLEIERGHVHGPLAGVPMAHKDMFYREGVPSSCGSRITRERPAPATAKELERRAWSGRSPVPSAPQPARASARPVAEN